jgi:hypothetical protein
MTHTSPTLFERLILRAVLNDVSPIVARVFSISDEVEITDLHDVFLSIVRSKYSYGFTVVVPQQPTQSFLAVEWPFALPHMTRHRQEQRIALALMIPLVMIMQVVLGKRMPQGVFPKENLP